MVSLLLREPYVRAGHILNLSGPHVARRFPTPALDGFQCNAKNHNAGLNLKFRNTIYTISNTLIYNNIWNIWIFQDVLVYKLPIVNLIQIEWIQLYLNKIDNGLGVNRNVLKNLNVFNIIGSYFCY